MSKNKKGFTLVEMLIVVAIIGILSGIILISVAGAREKAKSAKYISNVKQLALKIESIADVTTGLYPGTACADAKTALGLGAEFICNIGAGSDTYCVGVSGTQYLKTGTYTTCLGSCTGCNCATANTYCEYPR